MSMMSPWRLVMHVMLNVVVMWGFVMRGLVMSNLVMIDNMA